MEEIDGAALRAGAIAGGDEAKAAFEALWRAWYRRLRVFASSYRGLPASDRDDAVSEALIAAFGALPAYDTARPLSPWLYRVAANRFSDLARRGRRAAAASLGAAPEPAFGSDGPNRAQAPEPAAPDDPASDAAERDLAERCGLAIRGLGGRDRRIAMLAFHDGLGSAAIGAALGMPAGTVRWRLGAIRRTIRAAVDKEGR